MIAEPIGRPTSLATRRRLAAANPDDPRALKDLTNGHLNMADRPE